MLGDTDTGASVTRLTLPMWRDGNQSVQGGAGNRTTFARHVGVTRHPKGW